MSSDIRDRAENLTSPFYIQLAGIVQSLVAGYMVYAAARLSLSSPFSYITLLQFVVSGQLVVLTWHVNVQHAGTFHKLPTLTDSYLTFLYVAPQCLLVHYASKYDFRAWMIALFGFCLLTSLAYAYMYRISKNDSRNNTIFRAVGRYTSFIQMYIGAGGVTFLILGLGVTSVTGKIFSVIYANLAIGAYAWLHSRYYWQRIVAIGEHNTWITATGQKSERARSR